jgi:hypothetical protein
MKMVVESMEMALGAIPRPGRVPKQRLLPPKLVFDGGGAAELFMDGDWTI